MRVASKFFSTPIVCVDIETDGMNYQRGHILEVAVIRIENGAITDEFTTLINPSIEVPYFITNLTGITTSDLHGAPAFEDIADRLLEIMNGAVFVAHNVRFDYSFLKQEFRRIGIDFDPKQLCTVKLSRRLFPEHRSHKLASLIERHGFTYSARHRAYDDAHVVWQFLSFAQLSIQHDILISAISEQLRQPSIPKHLDRSIIDTLPTTAGIYIFEDAVGAPLYIGKSVNIRRRVMSHFTRDTEEYKEFKIAQSVHNITAQTTGGEMAALLLESQMIKTMQPLYNRQLRRTRKLIAAKQHTTNDGYIAVSLEQQETVDPEEFESVLAIYTKRSMAKTSLLNIVKTFNLCPKLLGLEKSQGACFSYQLRKCKGACIGKEPAETYNHRVLTAFENKRIDAWPFESAVIVQENIDPNESTRRGFIVDQWSITGVVTQEEDFEPQVTRYDAIFDFDAYKILRTFMTTRKSTISITPWPMP